MGSSIFTNAFEAIATAKRRQNGFHSLAKLSEQLGLRVLCLTETSLGYDPEAPDVLSWDISSNSVGIPYLHQYAIQQYFKGDEAYKHHNKLVEWLDITQVRTLDPYSEAITREMADDFDLHETFMLTILTDVGTICSCMMSGPVGCFTSSSEAELAQFKALCKLVMKIKPEHDEPREPSRWPSREKRVWEAMDLIADATPRKIIAEKMNISQRRVSDYIDEANHICAQFNGGVETSTNETQVILKILGFGDKFTDLMSKRL